MRRLTILAVLSLAACGIPDADLDVDSVESGIVTTRTNMNRDPSGTVSLSTAIAPARQLFMNNLDRIDRLELAIKATVAGGSVRVRVLDGCDNVKADRTTAITAAYTSPSATTWLPVVLDLPLDYGKYHYLEVTITKGQLVANTNRYEWGRLFTARALQLAYPIKKQDLMFQLTGTVDSAKTFMPSPTTNVLCPARCLKLGVEQNPKNNFNVLIREAAFGAIYDVQPGSFWTDLNTPGGMDILFNELRKDLDGDASHPGVAETVPYDASFSQMNFYVALEDPARDPYEQRGAFYCGNIDAAIDVVTYNGAFVATGGHFQGQIHRLSANRANWEADFGPNYRNTLMHEVFGHGVGHIDDQYYLQRPPVPSVTGAGDGTSGGPLATRSSCADVRPAEELRQMMIDAGDPDASCFQQTTPTACGSTTCTWIGSAGVAYWAPFTCIPQGVNKYDVGLSCVGNSGCYPSAAKLDQCYVGSKLMGAPAGAALGYTTYSENVIRDIMTCAFAPTCTFYDHAKCAAVQARWSFLPSANACELIGTANYIRRR